MPNWKAALDALFKKEDEDEIGKIINNIILDKISKIEVKLLNNSEECNDRVNTLKSLVDFNRNDVDELIKIIQKHYIKTQENRKNYIELKEQLEEEKEYNENDICELIQITQELQQSNEKESRKIKVMLLKTANGIVKEVNKQKREIDYLKKENRILNQKMDVLYEMIKNKK